MDANLVACLQELRCAFKIINY